MYGAHMSGMSKAALNRYVGTFAVAEISTNKTDAAAAIARSALSYLCADGTTATA
jgi:hypothetical protein